MGAGGRRTWIRVLGTLTHVTAAFLLAVAIWMLYASVPPRTEGEGQAALVRIHPGMSAGQVAEELHSKGLIRDKGYFLGVARVLGSDRQIKAGTYAVTPGDSLFTLLRDFSQGNVVQVRVTIPEGYSVKDIARTLSSHGLIDEGRFLELAGGRYRAVIGGTELPSLEGYLFPDTYLFTLDATEEQIIATMLGRFEQVALPHIERASSGLSPHQVVTLASIVEREAKVAEERPIIAGVYLNRLRIGMPLQADPTVIYALGEHVDRLLYSHLKVDSPYNTYLYAGLPPGPIANPGLASILSVLYPADTGYLYFVARGDGTHVFSRTYAEHERAVNQYR